MKIVKATQGQGANLDIAFIIVNSLFDLAMAVSTTTCTKYDRLVVEEQIASKNLANEQTDNLYNMIGETKHAIKELNLVFNNMHEVVTSNRKLNHEQSQLMDEISSIIDHSNSTTNNILKLTTNQEQISEKNSITVLLSSFSPNSAFFKAS